MSNNQFENKTEKTIEQKIAFLTEVDRKDFDNEFEAILSDKQYALIYGIPLENYSNPTTIQMNSVRERLYREKFSQRPKYKGL